MVTDFHDDIDKHESLMMGRTLTAPKRTIAEHMRVRTHWVTSLGRLRDRFMPAVVILLVVTGLSWPMIATKSGMNQDWPNHLWFLYHQSLNIRHNGFPSLFLTMSNDVFYPFYAFYGGTIYAIGGLLSLALGGAVVKAYVLMYMAGFASALGGFYWTARMAGVGRWLAHAPGFVFVTSSYILTDVYARGDWPEFLAICSIPLVVAAALSILHADRLRTGPTLALALATVVLFGSHGISLLWGSTWLLLTTITLLILVPASRRLVTSAGLLRVGIVMVSAAMVDGWFLLPTLAYHSHVAIGHGSTAPLLHDTSSIVGAHNLFTFSRATAVPRVPFGNVPDFPVSLPILAIVWVCVGAVLGMARAPGADMLRTAWIFIAWGVIFGIVMTHVGLIEALPHSYTLVQFQYRLSSYVLLSLGAAMVAMLALLSAGRSSNTRADSTLSSDRRDLLLHASRLALVPVLAVAAIGAVIQVAAYPVVYPDRNFVFASSNPPSSFFAFGDYFDISLRQLPTSPPLPTLVFPPQLLHHDRISLTYPAPVKATLYTTNLVAAPYLVSVHGASVVGRLGGAIVLRVPGGGPGLRVITLSRAERLPIVLGGVLSGLGLFGVLASLLWSVVNWLRVRRHAVA
jgi:hypothetical protein